MIFNSSSKYEAPNSFKKYGFRIVKNALNEQQVKQARFSLSQEYLKHKKTEKYLHTRHVFGNHELLGLSLDIMFNKKIVKSLKESLGEELAFFADINIHKNAFGISNWHFDSSSEQTNPYLGDSDYRFAKCGLPLQDNTKNWGGAIDIIPKSHYYHFVLAKKQGIFSLFRAFLYRFLLLPVKQKYFAFKTPVKAGDFIFFDSRLFHKSSKPSKAKPDYNDIPKEYTKYVFYWDACNENSMNGFLENSQKRAITQEGEGSLKDQLFYTDYLSRYYPTDYPKIFVENAKKFNIYIASLGTYKSSIFKKILNDFK